MNTKIIRVGSNVISMMKTHSNEELRQYTERLCRMCRASGAVVSTSTRDGQAFSVLVVRVRKGLDPASLFVYKGSGLNEPNRVIVVSGQPGNMIQVMRTFHACFINEFTPELMYTTTMAINELFLLNGSSGYKEEDLTESNFKFNSNG